MYYLGTHAASWFCPFDGRKRREHDVPTAFLHSCTNSPEPIGIHSLVYNILSSKTCPRTRPLLNTQQYIISERQNQYLRWYRILNIIYNTTSDITSCLLNMPRHIIVVLILKEPVSFNYDDIWQTDLFPTYSLGSR